MILSACFSCFPLGDLSTYKSFAIGYSFQPEIDNKTKFASKTVLIYRLCVKRSRKFPWPFSNPNLNKLPVTGNEKLPSWTSSVRWSCARRRPRRKDYVQRNGKSYWARTGCQQWWDGHFCRGSLSKLLRHAVYKENTSTVLAMNFLVDVGAY